MVYFNLSPNALKSIFPLTTKTSVLPSSSPGKVGIRLLDSNSSKTADTLYWQDGMFFYQAKKGEKQQDTPYAVNGIVRKINGRTLEIVSSARQQNRQSLQVLLVRHKIRN